MAAFRTPFFRSYLCNDPALIARVLTERHFEAEKAAERLEIVLRPGALGGRPLPQQVLILTGVLTVSAMCGKIAPVPALHRSGLRVPPQA